MQIINRLLDYATPWQYPDIYLFTGNPIINARGELVMGRGAARAVRDAYPGIAYRFGQAPCNLAEQAVYFLDIEEGQILGVFMVKRHWREPADIEIIRRSVRFLSYRTIYPEIRYHMNYPGIGNGQLLKSQVEPLLQCLPDNVFIYKQENFL